MHTHLNLSKSKMLELMCRGDHVISPGTSQARGCLILFKPEQFDEILTKEGDDNCRMAWLVAKKDNETYLFATLYGTNTKQEEFFTENLKH
jgi:hypothetical protein